MLKKTLNSFFFSCFLVKVTSQAHGSYVACLPQGMSVQRTGRRPCLACQEKFQTYDVLFCLKTTVKNK